MKVACLRLALRVEDLRTSAVDAMVSFGVALPSHPPAQGHVFKADDGGEGCAWGTWWSLVLGLVSQVCWSALQF